MPKYLIVADGYDSVATMQRKGPARSSFDKAMLKRWLSFLGVVDYDVCWARDAKLRTWKGPVIALGNVAHSEAVRQGHLVYKLPHPIVGSKTDADRQLINDILWRVKQKMESDAGRFVKRVSSVKVVK